MSDRIRIALVTYGMHVGGHEQSILRLYHTLVEEKFDVEIITTEEKGGWFDFLFKSGVAIDHIEFSPLGALNHILSVSQKLRKKKYKIIFLFCAKYAQAGIRMLPNDVIVIPSIRLDDELFYQLSTASLDAWNAVVVNSKKIYRITKTKVPEKPVIYIPNGVKLLPYSKLKNRSVFDERINLIFVGRLSPQKGTNYFPEILKRCGELEIPFQLTVVGDGVERKNLLNKFNEYNLLDKVEFKGTVSHEKVYESLLNSHVLLMPSLGEGFPNVLLEAQACGCVPVVSRLEGITDVATNNGQTGLLIGVGDVEGFAQAVHELYTNKDMWLSMSTTGHLMVADKFSAKSEKEAYIKLIDDALNSKYPLSISRKKKFPVDLSLFTWREHIPTVVKRIVRPTLFWRRFSKGQ